MTHYQFRAVTYDDRPEQGEIEAADSAEATRLLLNRGLYPLEITPFGRSLAAMLRAPVGRQTLSTQDAAQILADLGHLVGAGVEVAAAIAIVSATAERNKVGVALKKLLEAVRRGQPLSRALSEIGPVFPPHVVAVIRASEAAGSLAPGLQQVADEMRRAMDLRKQVQTALIYPSCIALAAMAAIIVLLVVVVPTLESLFGDALGRLPWQTRLLVGASQLMRTHGWILLLAIPAAAAAFAYAFRSPAFRTAVERGALRIPVLGLLLSSAETARVARLLAALSASRLPLVSAVELTCDGARLRVSRESLAPAAGRLRQGEALAQALADVPTLAPRLLRLVSIGEATGRLCELLEEGARGAEQKVTTAVERMLALLTPIMTIVFGVIAGFVLYAVMTAILSVNDLATMGR